MSSSKKKERRESSEEKNSDSAVKKLFDAPIQEKNGDGESFWVLGNNKRATINTFKNQTYVNLREYYEKDGETLATKKGITLNQSQWEEFKKIIEDIDK